MQPGHPCRGCVIVRLARTHPTVVIQPNRSPSSSQPRMAQMAGLQNSNVMQSASGSLQTSAGVSVV